MPPDAIRKPPVMPVPAATLLLLRDGAEGLEVLMCVRHDAAGFAAGAMVFPGGKTAAEDLLLLECASNPAGLDAGALVFRIAAIRESFEECGVLLARAHGDDALLSHEALAASIERIKDVSDFGAFVARARVVLATDLLVPFAHWITPVDQPKRFDTHFFLAPAPGDQMAKHDGREAVETRWITPAGAVAAADRGELKLVFATRANLLRLGRSRTVADALETARHARIVTVEPKLAETPQGPVFRIPADAGYEVTETPVRRVTRA
ncbi:MAG: NUDIX hydrolase [Acidobacteriota bacterium]